MDAEELAIRGRAAALLLNNPILTDAFQTLEEAHIRRWKAADTPEKREECHSMIVALDQLKRAIEYTMATGKVAESNIEYEKRIGRKVPNV